MTTAADTAAEKAFEAVLAGRRVPEGATGLAAFTEAVRATATQPGRPNAALAELLANGLIVDQPSPSPRTAQRRRRRMWFFTAIFAKIASAGALAQAATGAGVVLVGVTTAGAVGALPGPAQQTFDSVVQDVSGNGSQPAVTTPATTTTPTSTTPAATPAVVPPATATAGPTWKPERTEGEDGKEYGQSVSSAAHDRNDERKADSTKAPEKEDSDSAEAHRTPAAPTTARTGNSGRGSQHGDD